MTIATMKVMDPNAGDKTISWNKDDPDEIEDAQASFDFFTKEKKYMAYKVGKDGGKGEVIKKFDPSAERIILAPALVGG